ncbi:MAG: acyclic terpene utilization AtuA family protein, partial [Elusimicrobiota bacterium]
QLAYEMGDPRAYLGPDCTADFTSIRMRQDGVDRVAIDGVRGGPATPYYKVSASYQDGFKAVGELTISGPDALEKAKLCAEIVWQRLASDGFDYSAQERLVEFLGANTVHAGIAAADRPDPSEIVLRMGVKGPDQAKVDRFGMELVPLVTSGPPGVTGFAGGRPKATEIIGFWPALLRKEFVTPKVTVVTV